jgi:hypothetical protein
VPSVLGEVVLMMRVALIAIGIYAALVVLGYPLALLVAPWFRSKVRPR